MKDPSNMLSVSENQFFETTFSLCNGLGGSGFNDTAGPDAFITQITTAGAR